MIGWFNKRLNVPVEQRNYGLIYASLSLLLFIGTFWAVYNEIDSRRPWKDYQEQYRSLKVRVLKYQMKQLKAKVDKGELKKLNGEIKAIENQLQSGKAAEAKRQVDELSIQLRDVGQERANLKSVADNRNYLFEHNRKEGHIGASDEYRKERQDLEHQMAALDVKIDSLEHRRASIQEQNITPLVDKRKGLESTRDSIYGAVVALKKKIEDAESAPVKIQQVMLPDFDRSNFGNVKLRADRCMSCHMGITDPVMADTTLFTKVGAGQVFKKQATAEKYRKVFGPHPQSELLKLHPIEKFGCTGCHGGQPMSVDDVDHAHGFQEYWEKPLLKGVYVQGNCRSCHEGNYNFMTMEKVSNGRQLFIDFGCFECHDGPAIPDWQTYKVGPSLLNLSKKVTPEWAFNWVRDPQRWSEHTRMPNFQFSPQQAEQVIAYLFNKSGKSAFKPVSDAVPSGNVENGARTFREVGCIACHTIDEYEGRGAFKYTPAVDKKSLWPNTAATGNRDWEGNMFGPDLNKVGSKVSAAWLYDWVRNPKHYNPETRMPNLRLSDAEAADITAYLMTKKDPNPQATPALTHLDDPAWVKKGMDTIRTYGCYGCHRIEGMEKEGKVSVPLTDFGSKSGADLFFGYIGERQLHGVRRHFDTSGYPLIKLFEFVENGEDWFNWTILKMKNPRIFATDAIAQRMPVFNMTDEEAYTMTVLLRGYTKSYIPASYKDPGKDMQPILDDGRFLTHWNNCVGCHKIEEHGGYVQENLRKLLGLKGDAVLPYAPPSLNTIGAKAQEDWVFKFIRNPASEPVRTWLKIRMPTFEFTPEVISRIDKYFLGLEKQNLQFTDYSYYPATDSTLAAGKILFERLKCQQCHSVGSQPANGGATAVPAPNLALAGNRLKPEWIPEWVRDPGYIVPGTKMPNFFGTRDAQTTPYKDILGGDWKAQLNALRDYVWRLGGPKGTAPGRSTAPETPVATSPAPATPPVAAKGLTVREAAKKISMR
jgi:mono/diheme cytochrome c family protein